MIVENLKVRRVSYSGMGGSDGFLFFFFNDTATTEIYTLSLHDALPIYKGDIPGRQNGSMISMENGKAIPYSINNLQERGV